MRPANHNLQFRQYRRLSDVVVDAALNQVHRSRSAVVIRHDHYRHAEIADFIEESELLLNGIGIGIKVQDQDITLPLRDDFAYSVHATLEEERKLTTERRCKKGLQTDFLRIQQ